MLSLFEVQSPSVRECFCDGGSRWWRVRMLGEPCGHRNITNRSYEQSVW